jgi:hypothetical protein
MASGMSNFGLLCVLNSIIPMLSSALEPGMVKAVVLADTG